MLLVSHRMTVGGKGFGAGTLLGALSGQRKRVSRLSLLCMTATSQQTSALLTSATKCTAEAGKEGGGSAVPAATAGSEKGTQRPSTAQVQTTGFQVVVPPTPPHALCACFWDTVPTPGSPFSLQEGRAPSLCTCQTCKMISTLAKPGERRSLTCSTLSRDCSICKKNRAGVPFSLPFLCRKLASTPATRGRIQAPCGARSLPCGASGSALAVSFQQPK